MSVAELENTADGHVRVTGELSFNTAPDLAARIVDMVQTEKRGKTKVIVDLGAVNRADSAGLALLIEWRRQAERQQCTLYFDNIPHQLQAIANVSGVTELLPTV